jgi:hypothetical protein
LTLDFDQLSNIVHLLTAEEIAALWKFDTTGKKEDNFPPTLNPISRGRHFRLPAAKLLDANGKYNESMIRVIPARWNKRAVSELQESELFVTKALIKNVLCVTPRVGIFISRIKVLTKVYVPSGIVYKSDIDGFVDQYQDDVYTLKAAIKVGGHREKCFQQEGVKNSMPSARFTLKEPLFVPKNVTTKIVLTLDASESVSTFRNHSYSNVNNRLKKCFEGSVFQNMYFEASNDKVPIFLMDFEYFVKH